MLLQDQQATPYTSAVRDLEGKRKRGGERPRACLPTCAAHWLEHKLQVLLGRPLPPPQQLTGERLHVLPTVRLHLGRGPKTRRPYPITSHPITHAITPSVQGSSPKDQDRTTQPDINAKYRLWQPTLWLGVYATHRSPMRYLSRLSTASQTSHRHRSQYRSEPSSAKHMQTIQSSKEECRCAYCHTCILMEKKVKHPRFQNLARSPGAAELAPVALDVCAEGRRDGIEHLHTLQTHTHHIDRTHSLRPRPRPRIQLQDLGPC